MLRKMSQGLFLLAVSGFLVPLSASAKVVRGSANMVAIDSNQALAGPKLPASALSLLVGATTDNVAFMATPGDDSIQNFNVGAVVNMNFFTWGSQGKDDVRVNTNGILTFDQNNRGECNINFSNSDLAQAPNCRAKKFMPFWDDLIPVPGTSSITTGTTAGTAADFWYVQWNEFALLSNPAARLTFRVTYFEVGPAIRFNYIKLTGTGSDGSSATIGISQCRNRGGVQSEGVLYSYNTAVLPTGTATPGSSLFAIEFDVDADRDTLIRSREIAAGTSDASVDSDGCGESDNAEVSNGRNPVSGACPGDDVTTDTDSDGLVNTDEALLGTNPNVADTDGDTASDSEELTMNTDPLKADTDGDGWNDVAEDKDKDGNIDSDEDDNRNGVLDPGEDNDGDTELDRAESNPRDPLDLPALQLAKKGEVIPYPNHAQMALDAQGNAHIVTEQRDNDPEGRYVHYWMVKPDGSVGIGQTSILIPNEMAMLRPYVGVNGNNVFIMGESRASADIYDYNLGTSKAAVVRLNLTGHPQDGSPLAPSAIELNTIVQVPGVVSHHSAALGPNNVMHYIYDDAGKTHLDGEGTAETIRYAAIDSNGVLIRAVELADYVQSVGNGGSGSDANTYGVHKIHSSRVAVESDGTAHLIWIAAKAPEYQDSNYVVTPTGMYYATVSPSGQMWGPVYLGHGRVERLDMAISGSYMYVMTTSKDSDNDGFYQGQGTRLAVLDLASLSVVPRTGDAWGVDMAVSSSSFLTPFTTVYVSENGNGTSGAGLSLMSNGNAIMTFCESSDDVQVVVASPFGVLQSKLINVTSHNGRSDYRENRYKRVYPFGSDFAIPMAEWSFGDLRFTIIKGSQLPSVAPGPINGAPLFTSAKPLDQIDVGQVFNYQAAATDDATAAANLQWFLISGPLDATLSSSGLFSWTPHASDIGDSLVSINVCDDGTPRRCAEQAFVLSVAPGQDNYSPAITSRPAGEAFVGKAYNYQISVADQDLPNETFTYAITSSPLGDMAVSNSGFFTWLPRKENIGVQSVQVQVTDSTGRVAVQAFAVVVRADDFATGTQPTVDVQDGGCGCRSTSPADSLWLLAGAVALVWRRRLLRNA